jgi:hypothetical protein
MRFDPKGLEEEFSTMVLESVNQGRGGAQKKTGWSNHERKYLQCQLLLWAGASTC